MPRFAPRLPARLLDEIERQSKRRVPIAEINRSVGETAVAMGLPRPSYERVRGLVHEARRLRWSAPPSVSTVALDVAFRARPVNAIFYRLREPPAPRLRDRSPK
jgi:hypothetical protein